MNKSRLFAPIVCLLLACANLTTQAAVIVTVDADVQLNGALYHYEYTIQNDASSTLSLTDFALDVSAAADLEAISVPLDWTIAYSAGSTLFYTFSSEASTDIAPGASALISFDSPLAPANREFSIFALDSNTFEFETVVGTTLSPSQVTSAPVPEPASLALWGLGALGCAAAGYRRRRVAYVVVG